MAKPSWLVRMFPGMFRMRKEASAGVVRRTIRLDQLTAGEVLALPVSGPGASRRRRVRAGLAQLRYRRLRRRYWVPGSAYFVRVSKEKSLEVATPSAPEQLRGKGPLTSRRGLLARRIRQLQERVRPLIDRLGVAEDLSGNQRQELRLIGASVEELLKNGIDARARMWARARPDQDSLNELARLTDEMKSQLEVDACARGDILRKVQAFKASEDLKEKIESLHIAVQSLGSMREKHEKLLEGVEPLLKRLGTAQLTEDEARQADLLGTQMRQMAEHELPAWVDVQKRAQPLLNVLKAPELSDQELTELAGLGDEIGAMVERDLLSTPSPVGDAGGDWNGDAVPAAASIRRRALEMIDLDNRGRSPLGLSSFEMEEATHYDFPHYEFLVDPYRARGLNCNPLFDLEQLLAAARLIFWEAVLSHFPRTTNVGDYGTLNVETRLQLFTQQMQELFVEYIAESLYDYYVKLFPPYAGYSGDKWLDVLEVLSDFAAETASRGYDPEDLNGSFDSPTYWAQGFVQIHEIFQRKHPDANVSLDVENLPAELPFTPFPTDEVNFGLRILYRQEWVRLGTQAGELVRTIPLGPKQTEKVTTKSVIRSKFMRSVEALTATEMLRETSSTSKDSSEVVEEASEAFNIHTEASASGKFGFGEASAKAGTSYDTASSSKNTKSRLNEAMVKTSSKMRRETKVVVTTEREATDEFTTSSEITNPNDEIAVTYVYSKLQQQYQITTAMADVDSVVFVPMCMPSVEQIDEDWIKDHAWILARALLDSSFADDLALIATTSQPSEDPEDPNAGDNQIDRAMSAAIEGMKNYKDFTGNLPDVFRVAQEKYERQMDQRENHKQELGRRLVALGRLQKHIVANVLHYMRAKWRYEENDQRMMRLAQVMVPVHWEFVPYGGPTAEATVAPWEGTFVPDESPDALVRLTDLIDPGGPEGYVGNYAVYRVRGSPRVLELNRALSMLRSKYAHFDVQVSTSMNPGLEVLQAVALEPRFPHAKYVLRVVANNDWSVERVGPGGVFHVEPQASPPAVAVEFEGILIRLDRRPAVGSNFNVEVNVTSRAEDPELRFLKASVPLPVDDAKAEEFFDAETIVDMVEWLPALSDSLPSDLSDGWKALDAAAKRRVRDLYHEYLLLRDNSTRVLVDTNNLLLDLEVGQTPALEQYKRLSRAVDVLKLLEEYATQHHENARRAARLSAFNFADPEVDKLSILATSDEVRNLVGGLP